MSESYAIQLELTRRRALKDFYFFCKHVLANDKMEEQPHKELCEFITDPTKRVKKLILLPRGSFKSTVVTVGYSLWRILHNPNIRINIVSENYANACSYLGEIKQHIEENELFRALFGDLQPVDKGFWRQEGITVATRTRVGGKEPTIQVSSVGQTKVGMHYDYIVMDDPVSNNTTNTYDQMQKTIDYYKYLLSILDPGMEMTLIGTRYHFSDLYSHILDNEKGYDTLIRGCYLEDKSLYFPKRLTEEFLQQQRDAQGSWIFSTQYLNQPIDSESAVFRNEWIQFFENPPRSMQYFITIDPAATTNRESDFTAILVIGIDCHSNIYVVENHQLKITMADWFDLLFRKVSEYEIHTAGAVALETNAFQKTIKYALDLEMEKRRFWFPVTELKPNSTASKEKRIRALQPFFEKNKIFIKRNMDSLLDQILRFPKSKHDDQIDALSDVLQIMYTPKPDKAIDPLEMNPNLSHNEKNEWRALQTYTSRKVRKTKRYI